MELMQQNSVIPIEYWGINTTKLVDSSYIGNWVGA